MTRLSNLLSSLLMGRLLLSAGLGLQHLLLTPATVFRRLLVYLTQHSCRSGWRPPTPTVRRFVTRPAPSRTSLQDVQLYSILAILPTTWWHVMCWWHVMSRWRVCETYLQTYRSKIDITYTFMVLVPRWCTSGSRWTKSKKMSALFISCPTVCFWTYQWWQHICEASFILLRQSVLFLLFLI